MKRKLDQHGEVKQPEQSLDVTENDINSIREIFNRVLFPNGNKRNIRSSTIPIDHRNSRHIDVEKFLEKLSEATTPNERDHALNLLLHDIHYFSLASLNLINNNLNNPNVADIGQQQDQNIDNPLLENCEDLCYDEFSDYGYDRLSSKISLKFIQKMPELSKEIVEYINSFSDAKFKNVFLTKDISGNNIEHFSHAGNPIEISSIAIFLRAIMGSDDDSPHTPEAIQVIQELIRKIIRVLGNEANVDAFFNYFKPNNPGNFSRDNNIFSWPENQFSSVLRDTYPNVLTKILENSRPASPNSTFNEASDDEDKEYWVRKQSRRDNEKDPNSKGGKFLD